MNRFYQHLGELFYSIAMVDRTVRPEEEASLKKLIITEWVDLESSTDEYMSDSAFQIEAVFDYLKDQGAGYESNFENFRLFHESHQHLFTPKVNRLIMRTSRSIASSFAGMNKKELNILLQLELILKNKKEIKNQ